MNLYKCNMKQNLKEFYIAKVKSLTVNITLLKNKNRFFIVSELLSFIAALTAFIFYCIGGLPTVLLLTTIVLFAFYVTLRRIDINNSEKIARLISIQKVYSKELKYIDSDFSCFDEGEKYVDSNHSFTFDMDIFGCNSLYNRMCRSITIGGRDRLALHLQNLLKDKESIDRRREAIDELSENENWRTSFLSCGQEHLIDTKAITEVLRNVGKMKVNPQIGNMSSLILAIISIAILFILILLSVFTDLSADAPIVWSCIQLFIILMFTAKPLREISKAVNNLHKQLQSYIKIINLIAGSDFKSIEIKRLKNVLFSETANSLESFVKLSDILSRIDRRANILGLIIFNILFLSDFFLVRRFLKWQKTYLGKIEEWVDALSEIDSLVSMATFRYNEQDAGIASIVDSDRVVYEAKGLYHPFIGSEAIKNDFDIVDNNYYIITGANMAGKSTFLRSIGVNYILALNGMPVFADTFKVSIFNLFTSMRTTDDLTHGISYFNAELIRLKQLIDNCKQSDHTLIILDEILKGTNSLDKLNGSKLFLQEISKLPVTGVIATHDLELSKLEDENNMRFHNYCFEIKLEDNIKYSYKITKGVARNQNATYLLKNIIKSID